MLNSEVFETVFGLIFVFYATAVICSGIVEAWANLMRKRSKYLLRGLRDLLDGTTGHAASTAVALRGSRELKKVVPGGPIAEQTMYLDALIAEPKSTPDGAGVLAQLMAHPLVQPYKHTTPTGKVSRNPAYLPAPVFARALIDLAVETKTDPQTQRTTLAPTGVGAGNGQFSQVLKALIKTAEGSLEKLQASLESWFDGQMDRVSGSYKRWAKRWIIPIAVVVACAFNIDTVSLSRSLYTDGGVRAAVLQAAGSDKLCQVGPDGQPTGTDCVPNKIADLQSFALPVGWTESRWQDAIQDGAAMAAKLVGLLITVAAAALGAPFWFDVLNRLGSFRNVGRRPESSTS
jgi:hypothetical protein